VRFRTGNSMGPSDRGLGSYQVVGAREASVTDLRERIHREGRRRGGRLRRSAGNLGVLVLDPEPASRVQELANLRPFTFLAARLLKPSRDPDEMRSELVAFVGLKHSARRATLMALPRQRSWGSVVEEFIRHRDRKYVFDSNGRAIRRHVRVRKRNLVALGKEANRIEDSRVLGLRAVGGRAKRYVDPDPFKGSATEVARRLGESRRTIFNRRNDMGAGSGPCRGRRGTSPEEDLS
jgi:hypothetical protein